MSSEAELDISTWKRSILLVKMLKSHTAGMATKRPRAVVTSASAMPVETAAIPPDPVMAIPRNALIIPMTVPKRPMNGAVVPMVARPERPFRMSAVVIRASRSIARSAASIGSCPWMFALPLVTSC